MKGIYTAVLTAFNDDGSFNPDGQREIVRYAIDHCKVDGLFACGTIGERYKLPISMVKDVLRVCMDEAKKSVSMFANISALSYEETFELAEEAHSIGYDAVSMIPPFFHGYSQQEIVQYYRYIGDCIKLPILVYVIPSFSRVNFTEKMLLEILAHPNIIGMKFTHNDYYLLDRVRVKAPDAILFTGFDDVLFHALAMGTDGAIGGTYNITGLFAKKLYGAMKAGDYAKALQYQRHINDVEDMLNETGLFHTLKATMEEIGVHCGNLRIPNLPTNEEQRVQAKKIIKYLRENNG